MSVSPALTLEIGRWYAMTMYPGYANMAYRSPVEIRSIQACGNRQLDVEFYNVGYAESVQMMTKVFQIIRRHPEALIMQELRNKDRITIFEPLTIAWITAFMPGFGTMMIDALQTGNNLSGL